MGQYRRWWAILSICAFAASACGSAGTDSAPRVADTADPGDNSTVLAGTTSSANPTERAAELTAILLATMDDGTAIEALLFAVDAGYSADQIDAGIRGGGLDVDGLITSTSGNAVAPAGSAAGLILDDRATGSSSGFYAGLGPASGATLQAEPVRLLKQQQPELLPIGELRRRATDLGETIGDAGAAMVLAMITAGFDQEAIVGSLVLGGNVAAEELRHEIAGELRIVICPYINTRQDPTPIYVSRLCWYGATDGPTVYVRSADLPIDRLFDVPLDEPTDPASDSATDQGEAPPAALRTWEGRFEDTDGSVAWTTVRTTLVLVEEQPDGSLAMRRQTDSIHDPDLALLASACPYVYFDTGESTSPATRPADSLRFEGTRQGVYDEGAECADEGGPAIGSFTELVTGSLAGDVLTLNSWFDGEGPAVLDQPTTE